MASRREMFLAGEDVFLLGRRCFLLGEDVLAGEKMFSCWGEDVFLLGRRCFLAGEKMFSCWEGIASLGEDVFSLERRCFLAGEEMFSRWRGDVFSLERRCFLAGEEMFSRWRGDVFSLERRCFLAGRRYYLSVGRKNTPRKDNICTPSDQYCRLIEIISGTNNIGQRPAASPISARFDWLFRSTEIKTTKSEKSGSSFPSTTGTGRSAHKDRSVRCLGPSEDQIQVADTQRRQHSRPRKCQRPFAPMRLANGMLNSVAQVPSQCRYPIRCFSSSNLIPY